MRRSASLVVVTTLLLALTTPAVAAPRDEEVSRARVLDQQGVRAYKDGRYNDAIRYFSEAFKLGGPASELWNIAKCHLRLDEPEQASDAYDRYLMQQGLTPQDKAEAREELEELRRRKSILTVASAPSRAVVYVDGKRAEPAGTTPFSVQLPPGFHKIDIELGGYKTFSKDFDAKFGRAIIVDAQLERDPNQPLTGPRETPGTRSTPGTPPPPDKPEPPEVRGEYDATKHFTAKAEVGVVYSKLGTLPATAHPAFVFSASYWIIDTTRFAVGAGLLLHVTTDSWTNTIQADSQPNGCTLSITNNESATELAGYGIGTFAYRIVPRLRVAVDAGLGLAAYTASAVGGDVFYPTCQPSTGAQLAARTAIEVSYSFLPYLRGTLTPIAMQVHPSYSGVRSTPLDATGAWTRIGFGLGVALDL